MQRRRKKNDDDDDDDDVKGSTASFPLYTGLFRTVFILRHTHTHIIIITIIFTMNFH